MMRLCIVAIAILGHMTAYGQDWQTHYQTALKAYQTEDYSKAIGESEKAIALASSDVKGQAFSRQILTASCLATQMYDKGLAEVAKEIANFSGLEPNGSNHAEAIHKKGQLLMGLGNFEAAAASFHALSSLYAANTGKLSYEYLVAQAEEADALMQAKKYAEAQQAYETSIAGFKSLPDAGEDYLHALFNSGYIDYTQSHKVPASKKLSELIAFLEQNDLRSYPQYEEARRMLSSLNVSNEAESTGFVLPADRVRQLFEKAFALQQKDYQEALKLYKDCSEVIAEHQIVNNTSFSSYLNYARLLFAVGAYAESNDMLTRARDQAAGLYSENSAEHGHIQVLTADLALNRNDPKTASVLYQKAIANLKGETTTVWIKQIRWVAEQLIAAKAGELAIPVLSFVFREAAFKSFEVRDQIVLHQLNARAHLESRQADKLIQTVKPLANVEKNPDLRQAYLLFWAQAEDEKGNLQVALDLLLKGLTLAPSGIVSGELYFATARAYQQMGNYKDAEIDYRKALEHIVRSPSSETAMPLLFNSLAAFYIQLGNYGAAEKFFLNLLSHQNGGESFYNTVRQNLAALYQQTGRFQEAKRLLLKTLKGDALEGTDHPDYAIALQNLAAVYQQLHALDSAQLLYERALEIDKKQFGEHSLPFATKLANLGTVFQEAGNFAAAEKMFAQALAIRKELLSADHPDYAYSQYTLANLLYRTQKPREAFPLFKASADFYIRQIQDVFPALTDDERTNFFNRVDEVISSYQMFLLENIDLGEGLAAELLDFRLQTKALLLNSSLKVRNQILHSGDAALIRDFHVWQHTKDQLAYLFSLTRAEREEYAGLIDEYTQQANALEKSLSLKAEDFSGAFLPRTQHWREVQASLKAGEAAMEILRVKLKERDSVVYAAIVLKPGSAGPSMVVMPDGNFLEQKGFNAYINSIRYMVADTRSYDLFWKKLEPMLDGIHTLYLSPDGVYTKINCVTLYDPASKEYVVDRRQVMLISNLRDLAGKTEAKPIRSHALLIGAPDFRLDAKRKIADLQTSATRSTTIFTGMFKDGFAELPGTETEVQQIAHVLRSGQWDVAALLHAEALEEKVKTAKDVRLLHIATHGFFVAPKDEHARQVYSNDLNDIGNNSMLRSGLLLAGAEKTLVEVLSGQTRSQADDGILTAYEVMNLNLDDADLVVLSACETGTGDVKNGEGVYGLQRAFLLAGAKHVVMSLWKVDDTATQQLMAEFYAQWLGGKEKLAAFREAQVKMKERFPEPYYWGAFVMMGR